MLNTIQLFYARTFVENFLLFILDKLPHRTVGVVDLDFFGCFEVSALCGAHLRDDGADQVEPYLQMYRDVGPELH